MITLVLHYCIRVDDLLDGVCQNQNKGQSVGFIWFIYYLNKWHRRVEYLNWKRANMLKSIFWGMAASSQVFCTNKANSSHLITTKWNCYVLNVVIIISFVWMTPWLVVTESLRLVRRCHLLYFHICKVCRQHHHTSFHPLAASLKEQ